MNNTFFSLSMAGNAIKTFCRYGTPVTCSQFGYVMLCFQRSTGGLV